LIDKFRKTTLFLFLIFLSLYLLACQKGSSLKHLSPIQPPATLTKEITIDRESSPPEMTMKKENITVTISYWRRYDLNRKYNRDSMTSPFYFEEAWHQGDKVDVFEVTIKNDRTAPILFDVTECLVIDQGENEYYALTYDDNRKRLEYKKGHDITIENGLKRAKQILLETNVADEEIEPGETVKGFVPFRQVKSIAKDLIVRIQLETVPEKRAERYKKVLFEFPFVHDLGIRVAQPATMRF